MKVEGREVKGGKVERWKGGKVERWKGEGNFTTKSSQRVKKRDDESKDEGR